MMEEYEFEIMGGQFGNEDLDGLKSLLGRSNNGVPVHLMEEGKIIATLSAGRARRVFAELHEDDDPVVAFNAEANRFNCDY